MPIVGRQREAQLCHPETTLDVGPFQLVRERPFYTLPFCFECFKPSTNLRTILDVKQFELFRRNN